MCIKWEKKGCRGTDHVGHEKETAVAILHFLQYIRLNTKNKML